MAIRLQRELVDELNRRRAEMGLGAVEFDQSVANSAAECATKSLERGTLEHCGYEVLWGGSSRGQSLSARELLDAWWASPPHKTALTLESSTRAGGAVVYWADGRPGAAAAIEIDY